MPNEIRLQSQTNQIRLTLAEDVSIMASGGGDANYVHTQAQVDQSTTWNVNHNLDKYCSVTVVDNLKDVIIGEIHYVDKNNVTLTFTTPVWGWAYCN